MNFFKTLKFDKHKIEKSENLNAFQMCLIVPYYYNFFEDEINYIMKTKGPFMKVMLLNEVVKHPLFKPNFDIGNLFDSFQIVQYPYYSISITFHDTHVIKVALHKQM